MSQRLDNSHPMPCQPDIALLISLKAPVLEMPERKPGPQTKRKRRKGKQEWEKVCVWRVAKSLAVAHLTLLVWPALVDHVGWATPASLQGVWEVIPDGVISLNLMDVGPGCWPSHAQLVPDRVASPNTLAGGDQHDATRRSNPDGWFLCSLSTSRLDCYCCSVVCCPPPVNSSSLLHPSRVGVFFPPFIFLPVKALPIPCQLSPAFPPAIYPA